jgi:plasmid replication initiation protein
MAPDQLFLPGTVVKKHNDLVRCKLNIDDVTSIRIIDCLIANINPDDVEFQSEYSIAIPDFLLGQSKGGSQYALIRRACKGLLSARADCKVDNSTELYINLFSHIYYNREKRLITAIFNKFASPLLLQLKNFYTKYQLYERLTLSTFYSQKMYEILKSWQSKGEVELGLSDLHNWLGVPESFRNNFAQFRKFVLDKVHKEITTKTHLKYHWTPVKKDRKTVVGIKVTYGFRPALDAAPENAAKRVEASKENTAWGQKAAACAKERSTPCPKKPTKKCIACKKLGYLQEFASGDCGFARAGAPRPGSHSPAFFV